MSDKELEKKEGTLRPTSYLKMCGAREMEEHHQRQGKTDWWRTGKVRQERRGLRNKSRLCDLSHQPGG